MRRPDWVDEDFLIQEYENFELEYFYSKHAKFFGDIGIKIQHIKTSGSKIYLHELRTNYIISIIQNILESKYDKTLRKLGKLKISKLNELFSGYHESITLDNKIFCVELITILNENTPKNIGLEIEKHIKTQHCWFDLDSKLYIQDNIARLKLFRTSEIKVCTNTEIFNKLIRMKYVDIDQETLQTLIDYIKNGRKILFCPEKKKAIRKADSAYNDPLLCLGTNIKFLFKSYKDTILAQLGPYSFGINQHTENMLTLPNESYYNLDTASTIKNVRKELFKDESRRIVSKDPDLLAFYVGIFPERISEGSGSGEGSGEGSGSRREKKYKKKAIPKPVRSAVWRNWSKDSIDSKCYCCMNPITIENWEAGHIMAESVGGPTTVENLRPICGCCNKSMGAKNMFDFIREYSLPGVANIEIEEFVTISG